MNDKFGTTKLLTLSRQAKSAALLLSDSVAVRIGSESSSIVLVDSTNAEKLLIFQITHTQSEHQSACVEFLAKGDERENAKIQRVFVNHGLATEFASRLPNLIDRVLPINYAEQVPKSAQVLCDLKDSHGDDILYPEITQEAVSCQEGAVKCKEEENCKKYSALINSSGASGSHFTVIATSDQGRSGTKSLSSQMHSLLKGTRQALADLLMPNSLDAADEREQAGHNESFDNYESLESKLTLMLHNMTLFEQSETTKVAFANCVQPALQAYADAIRAETVDLGGNTEGCRTVYICDCIFNSQYCRDALLGAGLLGSKAYGLTIRFVKDIGMLGFLGALTFAD